MMNAIIIFCIIGATINFKAEACVAKFPRETTNNISGMISDFTKFFTELKINFELKLIEMKFSGSRDIIATGLDSISEISPKLEVELNKGGNVQHCNQSIKNLYTAIANACDEYENCIKQQLNLFKHTEKDIQNYLDTQTSCILMINFFSISVCTIENEIVKSDQCEDIKKRTNFTSGYPYICDTDKFDVKQKILQDKANVAVNSGKSNASNCLKQTKNKLQNTIDQTKKNFERCIANAV